MRAGGSLNTRVIQNDLNEIQSGQPNSPQLIYLPLLGNFRQGNDDASASAWVHPYGGRPDLRTDTGANPIIGNTQGGTAIMPTRIQLQQPANCLQLLWHALDTSGNYVCSFPINNGGPFPNGNAIPQGNAAGPAGWPLTLPEAGMRGGWAMGWVRLNGVGPWLPMSLMPSTAWMQPQTTATPPAGEAGGYLGALPFGGFSSIAAPMSFIDWLGYWSGSGNIGGPTGNNLYLLALASANMALSSNGQTLGVVSNYAVPSGSGPEQQPPNTDTQRSQDVLVRSGSNGR